MFWSNKQKIFNISVQLQRGGSQPALVLGEFLKLNRHLEKSRRSNVIIMGGDLSCLSLKDLYCMRLTLPCCPPCTVRVTLPRLVFPSPIGHNPTGRNVRFNRYYTTFFPAGQKGHLLRGRGGATDGLCIDETGKVERTTKFPRGNVGGFWWWDGAQLVSLCEGGEIGGGTVSIGGCIT